MRMSKGLYMRSLRNDADGSCLRRCVCPLARALLFIYAASVAPLRFASLRFARLLVFSPFLPLENKCLSTRSAKLSTRWLHPSMLDSTCATFVAMSDTKPFTML